MSKRTERPNLIIGRHTYSATEITILSRDPKAKVNDNFCLTFTSYSAILDITKPTELRKGQG